MVSLQQDVDDLRQSQLVAVAEEYLRQAQACSRFGAETFGSNVEEKTVRDLYESSDLTELAAKIAEAHKLKPIDMTKK